MDIESLGPLNDLLVESRTAVFLDIENIVRIYIQARFVPLADILAVIRAVAQPESQTQTFAVARAYANWTDGRLRVLRREMVEGGVHPAQVFEYDRPGVHNAADIELCIDAVDLAHTRPALTTFVIVTNDGGFASLAKKLHELGKLVIVCAGSACSRALRANADAFVQLPSQQMPAAEALERSATSVADDLPVADADDQVKELVAIEPVFDASEATLPEVTRHVVSLVSAEATRNRKKMDESGIILQDIGVVVNATTTGLRPGAYGFRNFSTLLRYCLADSSFAIVQGEKDHHQLWVIHKGRSYADRVPMDPLTETPASMALYRSIVSGGERWLRLPERAKLERILGEIATSAPRGVLFDDLVEQVAYACASVALTADVKFVLMALNEVGAIHRTPPRTNLNQARCSLPAEMRSGKDLAGALRPVMAEKIRDHQGRLNDRLLDAYLGLGDVESEDAGE